MSTDNCVLTAKAISVRISGLKAMAKE